jgi:hypothetical protein
MVTNDARRRREIKSRIAVTKAAFKKKKKKKKEEEKKKTRFTSKFDLNLRQKLVKCYIWGIASYGSETWTLLKAVQKYLESFEIWCWRRVEK